ncbi:MAG: hypothetical protein ACRDPF_07085 [Streptosporangiaceae bacterium]
MSALNVARGNSPVWSATLPATVVAGAVVPSSAVWVGTSASTLVALSPASGAVLSTIALPGAPGGGGQYSSAPSDIGIGNNVLVVPTGSPVTAFGRDSQVTGRAARRTCPPRSFAISALPPRVSGLMGLPQTEGGGDGAAGKQ